MPTMAEAATALQNDFNTAILALGYDLTAADEGKTFGDLVDGLTGGQVDERCITAHITARGGSPDPPDGPILTRMRKRILPRYYQGYPVCTIYG